MKILIIDDATLSAESLAELLKARGHEVVWASNADAAMNRIDGVVPDVLVLDVVMPGQDGLDAFRTIRQRPGWGWVPVIILTALANESLWVVDTAVASLQPAVVIRKPADVDELLQFAAAMSEHT